MTPGTKIRSQALFSTPVVDTVDDSQKMTNDDVECLVEVIIERA